MSNTFNRTFIPIPQLPNLIYPPDKDIVLGTVLTNDRDPRQPLSRKPLVPIGDGEITKDATPRPWHWRSDDKISGKAGIWAKLSFLPFGGSLGGGADADNAVAIDSDEVSTQFFSPDQAYKKKLVENPIIKGYVNDRGRPWVHLVISIMVAKSATFEVTRGRRKGFKAGIQADASGSGVPLAVGADAMFDKSKDSTLRAEKGDPFVLAYQLLKVRPKPKDNSVESKYDNEPALFDDEEAVMQGSLDDWEFDEATLEEVWGDM